MFVMFTHTVIIAKQPLTVTPIRHLDVDNRLCRNVTGDVTPLLLFYLQRKTSQTGVSVIVSRKWNLLGDL